MSAELRRAVPGDLAAITALQHAAYAKNRVLLGVEPLPLQADYAEVLRGYEVWVTEALDAVLILEPRADDLLVWSVASAPQAQGAGLGNHLLAFAERRARENSVAQIRLYTGGKLSDNVAWYHRKGYVTERIEHRADRTVVHLIKHLSEGD